MDPVITLVHVKWSGAAGATGYAIRVNGVKVASTGPNARTSKLAIKDAKTKIEVYALPASVNKVWELNVEQAAA